MISMMIRPFNLDYVNRKCREGYLGGEGGHERVKKCLSRLAALADGVTPCGVYGYRPPTTYMPNSKVTYFDVHIIQ